MSKVRQSPPGRPTPRSMDLVAMSTKIHSSWKAAGQVKVPRHSQDRMPHVVRSGGRRSRILRQATQLARRRRSRKRHLSRRVQLHPSSRINRRKTASKNQRIASVLLSLREHLNQPRHLRAERRKRLLRQQIHLKRILSPLPHRMRTRARKPSQFLQASLIPLPPR